MSNLFLGNDLFSDEEESSRETVFLRQLAAAYNDIYASGLAIVGNGDDADDVIQEVCVVLWKRYDEFEQGTNFRKWACTVAFNVAKAFARKQRRRRGYGMSDQALQRVAQIQSGGSELLELQRDLLQECMDKLSTADRKFLFESYLNSDTLAKYARGLGMSIGTVYSKVKRLRRRLAECVHRSLKKGDL
ncbi:sigma-70 family RNA polymerase sigma factor [Planctomicrobium sp. SH661]|uniref:sigma-70 family RNA polymerase sigma factor n=1 Tax=Planctomicrobium sp. SH661 TaxID=3448124 RepID=UPI003F5B47DF